MVDYTPASLEQDNSDRAGEVQLDENLYRAIEAIDNCERPVIYAGEV